MERNKNENILEKVANRNKTARGTLSRRQGQHNLPQTLVDETTGWQMIYTNHMFNIQQENRDKKEKLTRIS